MYKFMEREQKIAKAEKNATELELKSLREENADLLRLLHHCEQSLTRYAYMSDAAHWPPIPPQKLLRELAKALAKVPS